MLIAEPVMIGATPISSSSTIFFFISRLSNGSNILTYCSRFFSLTKATKIAAIHGRSKRMQCAMRPSRFRNVEIGHFCNKMKALARF